MRTAREQRTTDGSMAKQRWYTQNGISSVAEPKNNQSEGQRYARAGHPSIEELVAEQGTRFRPDPADLLGDFWPEEEAIEDFLESLHEWRGHHKSDRAA